MGGGGGAIALSFLLALLCLAAVVVDRRDVGDFTAESLPQEQQQQGGTWIRGLRGQRLMTARETGGTKHAKGRAELSVGEAAGAEAPGETAVAPMGDGGGARVRWGGSGNPCNGSSGGALGGGVGRRSLLELELGSAEQGDSRGGHDGAAGWHGKRCWVDPSGRRRCQANVFLFGVSKCGTTSLAAWMTHHPALRWVSNLATIGRIGEEAHVLDEMGNEEFHAMLRQGPSGKYGQTAPTAEEEDKVVDYTPHCSIKAEVPYRILDIYGEAARNGGNKYLVQLRDPVTRAISSWQRKFDLKALEADVEEWETAGDTRSLAEAVRQGEDGVTELLECQESERRAAGIPWGPEQQKAMDLEKCRLRDFLGETHGLYWAHIAKGMYAMQLERWFGLFGRENVKVTFLEETAANPVEALESIFDFIGLDLLDEEGKRGLRSRGDWERVVGTIHNETEEERKKKLGRQVTPSLVLSMRKFFAPHNARLEELLGRPLPENWST